MSENQFFKPTVLYKEYMILDMIEKNSRITQREMGQQIGIAVSMVNEYIDKYEKQKLLKKIKHSTKNVEYFVTSKGLERRKYLNIGYLNSAQRLYNGAKENIEKFLKQIKERGFNNVILYGAGEVAEILLNTIKESKNISISAIAIIDDDVAKIGETMVYIPVISIDSISQYKFDGILISSFTNKEKIKKNILETNFDEQKLIEFFN